MLKKFGNLISTVISLKTKSYNHDPFLGISSLFNLVYITNSQHINQYSRFACLV